MTLVKRFLLDECGATAIEYGLIAALVSLAAIGGASTLGNSIDDRLSDLSTPIDNVVDTNSVVTTGGD